MGLRDFLWLIGDMLLLWKNGWFLFFLKGWRKLKLYKFWLGDIGYIGI